MPVLVVDGEIQAGVKRFRVAGRCEWCGSPMDESRCCTVTSIFDGDLPDGVDRMTVLTRLCGECVGIYARMGRDGLCE